MQAFLTFPSWMPGSLHDRNSPDKMACSRPRQVPVVEIPLLNKLKRARSVSVASTSPDAIQIKKQRTGDTLVAPQPTPLVPTNIQMPVERQPSSATVAATPTPAPVAGNVKLEERRNLAMLSKPERRSRLQQKIEAQFNLEILLKHNELRLIEQELAKCQIALEQIRRCEALPYPGEAGSGVSMEQVSSGTGPSLMPAAGYTRPPQPAPWGLIDGPYSRHYAQWLIPAAEFDSSPVQAHRYSHGVSADARSTRGTLSDRRLSGKSRTTASANPSLHALATNYATPKDRAGPLVIKRPCDGTMVKLVCHECNRENFSSVQGFLNHCRIAHGRNFESHGAAADACGVAIDTTETLAPETPIHIESTATTPHTGRPLVHPFITSARTARDLTASHSTTGKSSTPASSVVKSHGPAPRSARPFAGDMAKGQFVPSAHTPRLSALVKKYGLGADFSKIVDAAKQKIDLEQVESLIVDEVEDDADQCMDVDKPAESPHTARDKPRSTAVGGRAPSSRARPTPLQTDVMKTRGHVTDSFTGGSGNSSDGESQSGLSPHTIETNPGLISDREDEDFEDHLSRTSEEDSWSEQDHRVQVRQHHHHDDEALHTMLAMHDDEDVHIGGNTCVDTSMSSPVPATTPVKRKRGRPCKKDQQNKK